MRSGPMIGVKGQRPDERRCKCSRGALEPSVSQSMHLPREGSRSAADRLTDTILIPGPKFFQIVKAFFVSVSVQVPADAS